MKRFLFIVITALIATSGIAAWAAAVRGRAIDASDKSSLADATVRLLRASKDSAFVAGTTADADGKFTLQGIKAGKYVLMLSYIGYNTTKHNVTVGGDNGGVNVGDIALAESSIMLKEATVVGVKTEIKVKEDTVEYNADSYKTQPNAVVEDLLKRLPGVEVDSEGKITAQGKEVKKILVDGKEFFADDPKVASKNIPVEMIDKLQVVDRKSDLARLTGVDDGEDETVINLTVKKGMNNGWFGTVTGGYGTDNRYTGNFMINHFSDGNQLTLLGGANNTNEMAFTDGGAGRFTRFGGQKGINTSQSIGANFNVGSSDEKLRVGGSVIYSHSDRDTYTNSNYQYLLLGDQTKTSNTSTRDKGHNVNGDFRIKWEVDSFNTLEFRPNFNFSFSNSLKADSTISKRGSADYLSRSLNDYANDGKSYEFSGRLIYNHKFRSHPGRSYSAQVRYSFSNVKETGSTFTNNTYYNESEKDETIDQIYDNHRWSNAINWRLTWTEPLGDVKYARFLTFAYRGNYKFNNADKLVYDINCGSSGIDGLSLVSAMRDVNFRRAITDKYSTLVFSDYSLLADILEYELGQSLNTAQSSQFRNDYFTQTYRLGFKQVRKEYNLDAGLSLNSSMMRSHDIMNEARNIPSRWTWNVAPYARLRMKFSKAKNLAVDYRANNNQPSITQLQPVADRSNPLRIVVGNPDLKATFTQRLNIRYHNFNQQSQLSLMAMAGAQYSTNSIVSKVDYDKSTGGQTITYANVNGVWNADAMSMVSFPFRRKSWYFSTMGGLRYSSSVAYNNGVYNRNGNLSFNVSPGISFRPDNVELELRPNYRLQTSHNSAGSTADRTIHTYGGSFNASYYTPIGIVLNTDLRCSATSGYSDGYNSTQWLWNAELSYQFLRDKAATISAKVFDILRQRQSISRNVTASYIQDVESNTLTRYVMFTFTYKFTTFGSQKDNPKMRNDFGGYRRPMDLPPGGGRRPMGPPPGR